MVKNDQITVVIVSYNSSLTIGRCLESVLKFSKDSRVIVIDNSSQDDTLKVVKKYQAVSLLKLPQNFGFAKANNLAAKDVESKFLAFLNPDSLLKAENCLALLATDLVENNSYGLIAPKIVDHDLRLQKNVRNLPTVWRAAQEYLFGIKGKYDFYDPKCHSLCSVESVKGACLLITTELFKQIGGFNEKYFLYYEDLELCEEILSRGLKVGFDPVVEIEHFEGASGKGSNTKTLLKESAKKYHGLLTYLMITLIIRISKFVDA